MVNLNFKGSDYTYSEVNNLTTWRDSSGMIIPTFMHSVLRKYAISQGFDKEIFVTNEVIEANTVVEKKHFEKTKKEPKGVSVKNNKLSGGFNPFAN